MSYIGNDNITQGFIPAIDFFSGNGSTTAFTLSRPVASVAQVEVYVSNVPQTPNTAYSVSGNTITFTSAPPSGTNNIYVYYTSPITQVIAPGQGTVNTTSLGNITNIASGNSNLTLQTGTTPTTAMTIDTSQNVGVGTASPNAKLEVTSRITASDGGGASRVALNIESNTSAQTYSAINSYNYGTSAARNLVLNESGGYVGIGTLSPTTTLTISTAGGVGAQMFKTSAGSNSMFGIYDSPTSGNTSYTLLGTDTSGSTVGFASGGNFLSVGNNGTGAVRDLIIHQYNAANIKFATSNAERMRIDSSGNLLVGATSVLGNERLNVTKDAANQEVARFYNANNSTPWGMLVQYSAAAPNGTSNSFIGCYDTVGTRATIRSNGGIANYQGNNVNLSDRREKTNFAPAKPYLDVICAIPVQTFNYIDQNMEEDAGLTLGVVAQDVQAVAPELITESNWGTEEEPKMRLSIYQTDLQYALMKCIQEQQALIQTLTDRITALENK